MKRSVKFKGIPFNIRKPNGYRKRKALKKLQKTNYWFLNQTG